MQKLSASSIHSDATCVQLSSPRLLTSITFLLACNNSSSSFLSLKRAISRERYSIRIRRMWEQSFVFVGEEIWKLYFFFKDRIERETEARFVLDVLDCHFARTGEKRVPLCVVGYLPTYLSTYHPAGEISSPKAPHLSSWDHLR